MCLAVVETVLALEKQQQRPVTSRPTWKSTPPVFKRISISRRKWGFRGRTESTLSKTGAMLSFHCQAGGSTGLSTHFAGPTGSLLHRGAEVTKRGEVRLCPGEAGRFEQEGMQSQHSGTQRGHRARIKKEDMQQYSWVPGIEVGVSGRKREPEGPRS